MQILEVGPWCLLGVGLFVVVETVRREKPSGVSRTLGFVFGGLLSGVGVYGPAFMEPYTDFVETVLQLRNDPSAATRDEFLAEATGGEMSEDTLRLGVAQLIEHPVSGTEDALREAVGKTADPVAKKIFEHGALMVALKGDPTPDQCDAFLEVASKGELEPADLRLGMDWITKLPVAEIDAKVTAAVERTTDAKAREILLSGQAMLQARELGQLQLRDGLRANPATRETLEKLTPAEFSVFSDKILMLRENQVPAVFNAGLPK